MNDEERRLKAQEITAIENYAHARDHESLRAQVTAILVAAAFVLIGLALDKLSGTRLIYVSVAAIVIGSLNIWLVILHNNRFDRHVAIAREAKSQISVVEAGTNLRKFGNLGASWLLVAALPVMAGLALLILSWAGCITRS